MIKKAFPLVALLAATAVVLPAQPDGTPPTTDDAIAACMALSTPDHLVSCGIAGAENPEPPASAGQELPVQLSTDQTQTCVRGNARPIVDTTTPTMSAVFIGDAEPGFEATFELRALAGTGPSAMSFVLGNPGEPVVNETWQNYLEPGVSYRWRVRGTPQDPATGGGWSDWCEFTIKPGLVEMSDASDPDVVRELGVVPADRYPVTLTAGQWLLVMDAIDGEDDEELDDVGDDFPDEIGNQIQAIADQIRSQTSNRTSTVTLTGAEWATVAMEIAGLANGWDQLYEEEPEVGQDGTDYWKVVDRISAELGGPKHTTLGFER
ncbi:hypothetical protein FB565_007426 [Actinoplanes lutulentus]|uniref:Uncharacterized protein n=1 Tax=Actinoplanes lutulentus TaxID=1287878 RepID=A0A327Z0N0_9ACTN|nr:hypothetical protein [Actinoplanes lutulentus]MBB2947655.1 hypothetical protein [Actinoplanes lutulentus]RAK27711.1 hypothetical protein B0I29_12294 [Actinoplanes lutulentus]